MRILNLSKSVQINLVFYRPNLLSEITVYISCKFYIHYTYLLMCTSVLYTIIYIYIHLVFTHNVFSFSQIVASFGSYVMLIIFQ